jgi:hypothetical protein
MASKHRCEVPIQLDIPRTLKLDFNACADFQEAAGISIDTFFFRIQQISKKYHLEKDSVIPPEAAIEYTNALGMNHLRLILWVGLRHDDPNLTVKDAGELVNFAEGDNITEQYSYIVSKVCDAYAMRQVGNENKKKQVKSSQPNQD